MYYAQFVPTIHTLIVWDDVLSVLNLVCKNDVLGLLYEYGGLTNLVEVSIPDIKRMFNTFEYMQDSWQLINRSIAKMASCVCSSYNYNFFTRWRFCQNETSVMRYEIRRCDLLYHTPMNNQSMKWKWKLSSTTTHDEPITRRSVT